MLRAVKTKQVTHAILRHLTEYVKSLENAGLLEAKETLQLHDAVQVWSCTIVTYLYLGFSKKMYQSVFPGVSRYSEI